MWYVSMMIAFTWVELVAIDFLLCGWCAGAHTVALNCWCAYVMVAQPWATWLLLRLVAADAYSLLDGTVLDHTRLSLLRELRFDCTFASVVIAVRLVLDCVLCEERTTWVDFICSLLCLAPSGDRSGDAFVCMRDCVHYVAWTVYLALMCNDAYFLCFVVLTHMYVSVAADGALMSICNSSWVLVIQVVAHTYDVCSSGVLNWMLALIGIRVVELHRAVAIWIYTGSHVWWYANWTSAHDLRFSLASRVVVLIAVGIAQPCMFCLDAYGLSLDVRGATVVRFNDERSFMRRPFPASWWRSWVRVVLSAFPLPQAASCDAAETWLLWWGV